MTEAVLFAYDKAALTSKMLPGRSRLFTKLADRDLKPVISEGAEKAFHGTEVAVAELYSEQDKEQLRPIGSLAVHNEIKVIVNRAGGSLSLTDMPPMINENATRALGRYKWDAHQKVLEPLGIGIPTQLITSGEDIDAFLADQTVSHLIAKPQTGTFGKNVQKVERDRVADLFAEHPEWAGKYLLQPAYHVSGPLPASMRPYDAAARAGFELGNGDEVRKELRMYGFYAGGEAQVFPVGRALIDRQDGYDDHWFFVDPETVPDEVHEGARAAFKMVAEATGAVAVHGTADYIHGSANGDDPSWKVVELNLRAPYLVGYEAHAGAADVLHTMFADQIDRTARPS